MLSFPEQRDVPYDIPRLGIPSAYLADGPHRLAMAAKAKFDSHTYPATEFPSSTTVAATFNPDAAHRWDVLWVRGEGLWFGCVAGTGCQPDAKCALRT